MLHRSSFEMPTENLQEQKPLPKSIVEFITAFLRTINSAKLYAKGHNLLIEHSQQLHLKFRDALGGQDSLFLGCAHDSFLLEGDFYQAKEQSAQKFLKFFHALGISHIVIDNETTAEEMALFIELLAGAREGQGGEVSSTLIREKVKNIKIGVLDYSIFSAAQGIATQFAQSSEDEALWRKLILTPATGGTFNLSSEKIQELTKLSQDVEELKHLLLKIDSTIMEKQAGISAAQRGILLGSFLQNLENTLTSIQPKEKRAFAQRVSAILDSFEPKIKTQILGSVAVDASEEAESGVIPEIIQAMPDRSFITVLINALKEGGANSQCFNNLFKRTMNRYGEPNPYLSKIREEMDRLTAEGKTEDLSHWQQLEQILVQQQETDALNEQYQKEIEALATSLQLQQNMVEEEEKKRLLHTNSPKAIQTARARLLIDIINQSQGVSNENTLLSLLDIFGNIIVHFYEQKDVLMIGKLLPPFFIAINKHPQANLARKKIEAFFKTDEIREVMESFLEKCKKYDSTETASINALCQLFPKKAGAYLLDLKAEFGDLDGPKAKWLSTALASLGPEISEVLGRKIENASDEALPGLLKLALMLKDRNLASSVLRYIEHKDHNLRLNVIDALGKLKAKKAVPHLAEILKKESYIKSKKVKLLQLAAARALGEIGTDAAKKHLKEIAEKGSGELKKLCQEIS
jgi:hypothetical protein